MKVEELFLYIDNQKIKSEFITSLATSYAKYGKLTEKQYKALFNIVNKDKKINQLFAELDQNDFILSLKNFYHKNKFLTKKQYEALCNI